MQLRQKEYEEKTRSSMDDYIKGPGPAGLKLLTLPLFLPMMVAVDVLKWANTPYPVISEREEKRVADTLIWRNKADFLLDSLFARSQQEIDRYASTSYVGSAARVWDSFLDQQSEWRNQHAEDEKTLRSMVRARKRANS